MPSLVMLTKNGIFSKQIYKIDLFKDSVSKIQILYIALIRHT